ncbi:MAG TPA: helix-turn-helix transcriptional regulator [Clostridiales bacterium]|nr:helix-turn-helix transcriptional regulator [Clostridiales bacterium]
MYERIRNLREDRDMTQTQVARRLSIHQTTYSDYELGNLNIPVPILDQLADLFGTSIDYLVNRTDEPKPYPKKPLRPEAKQ